MNDFLTTVPTLEEIPARIRAVQEAIREAEQASGRAENSVKLQLAVKYQPAEKIAAALQAGVLNISHNIIQQLEETETELSKLHAPAHNTHVIGHVQSNKVGKALEFATCIETVDSIKLANRINRLQETRVQEGLSKGPYSIFIQVNSSGAESQWGITPEETTKLAEHIASLEYVQLDGLMTIGAHTDNTADIARSFAVVRQLRDDLQANIPTVTELSMGMTNDLNIAVQEGSTMVRVGRAVFGPRPRP